MDECVNEMHSDLLMKVKPPIKVVYRKLGKEQAHGLAFKEERVVHIDPRLNGEDTMHTIIHEIIHIQNPKWPEIKVQGHAREMFEILWREGFRRVQI